MIDLTNCKNISSIKNKIRIDLTKEIMDFLIEHYGVDNVSQIGTNEIAAAVGEAKDENGFLQETCAVVKVIAKPFYCSQGEKRETELFDRYQAAEDYQFKLKQKTVKEK